MQLKARRSAPGRECSSPNSGTRMSMLITRLVIRHSSRQYRECDTIEKRNLFRASSEVVTLTSSARQNGVLSSWLYSLVGNGKSEKRTERDRERKPWEFCVCYTRLPFENLNARGSHDVLFRVCANNLIRVSVQDGRRIFRHFLFYFSFHFHLLRRFQGQRGGARLLSLPRREQFSHLAGNLAEQRRFCSVRVWFFSHPRVSPFHTVYEAVQQSIEIQSRKALLSRARDLVVGIYAPICVTDPLEYFTTVSS